MRAACVGVQASGRSGSWQAPPVHIISSQLTEPPAKATCRELAVLIPLGLKLASLGEPLRDSVVLEKMRLTGGGALVVLQNLMV